MALKVIRVYAKHVRGPRYVSHVRGPGFCLLEDFDCRKSARVLKFDDESAIDQQNMKEIIDRQAKKVYHTSIVDLPGGFA